MGKYLHVVLIRKHKNICFHPPFNKHPFILFELIIMYSIPFFIDREQYNEHEGEKDQLQKTYGDY